MSTIHVSRWHHDSGVLLMGDAAHGIVPFHGQGMNCAFEDCAVLDGLLGASMDWIATFAQFARLRYPDTESIARMAVENYEEMRNSVRDPAFQLQKKLSLELEQRHPERFIPRYSMVSFHAEIPYSEAERRGAIQQRILTEALRGRQSLDDLDYQRIEAMSVAQLEPLGASGSL
jgi:kynurenine 3-monooxygenase